VWKCQVPQEEHILPKIDLLALRRDAREQATRNKYYRQYIKEALPLSNDALDAEVSALADGAFERIDCLDCGNCCRRKEIAVTSKDVRRSARALGISTDQFVRRYVAETRDGDAYIKGAPCPFLGSDNACSIYADRPQACREFPYLHERKVRARTLTMLENVGECPIVADVWGRLMKQYPEPPKG
jgi:Fe-S-cluster containining protein